MAGAFFASMVHVSLRLAVLPIIALAMNPSLPLAKLVLWPLVFLYGGAVAPAPGGGGAVEFGFKFAFGHVMTPSVLGGALIWWRFYTFYLYVVLGALAAGNTVMRALREESRIVRLDPAIMAAGAPRVPSRMVARNPNGREVAVHGGERVAAQREPFEPALRLVPHRGTAVTRLAFPASASRVAPSLQRNTDVAESADAALQLLAINTVRTLSMDAVQQAESGHPGTPMALAPLAYALYHRHVRHNPADPHWPNRDRVVLSCGHASMLLYSTLFLCGYDLSLDDIKAVPPVGKQDARPPGGRTHGGRRDHDRVRSARASPTRSAWRSPSATSPRRSIATATRSSITTRGSSPSDGDLMEGISHEAASFAGHQKLGKLIGFFDSNHITIDGGTDISCSDDAAERFEAYGWHVQHVADVNDLDAIDRAIDLAKAETDRPSLIVTRTHIGYGSPNKVDTFEGARRAARQGRDPARQEGTRLAEPGAVLRARRRARALARGARAGATAQEAWRRQLIAYAQAFPDDAKELGRRLHGDLPAGWEAPIPVFDATNGNVASRAASGAVLNAFAPKLPELVGGSADLAGSTLTTVKGAPFGAATRRRADATCTSAFASTRWAP